MLTARPRPTQAASGVASTLRWASSTRLDPQSRAHLWEEVERLRERGTTVFLTTHYLEEADSLCDQLAIIDHGLIVAEGRPDELKRAISGEVITIGIRGDTEAAAQVLLQLPFVRAHDPHATTGGVLRVYVDNGDAAIPSIVLALHGAGFIMDTIALTRPSLDDVFLRQTGRSLREVAA